MKRLFTVLAFFSFAALAAVDECQDYDSYLIEESRIPLEQIAYNYLKIGAGAPSLGQNGGIGPILGIGRRMELCENGIDVSAMVGYAPGNRVAFYSLPRIMYLLFCDPFACQSFYYGGGLSWGGLYHDRADRWFHGVQLELAAGYEMMRNSCRRAFWEVGLVQPLIPASRSGCFPTPSLNFTFNLGF